MSKTGVPALSGSGTFPPPGFQMAALMPVFIWWREREPVCPLLFLLGHQLQHESTSFMTSASWWRLTPSFMFPLVNN